ncbi:MAG: HD-GYP domain-containing protein [Clostridia bacterium]|nr:HD-GYP domain-containing protein [Clostridia bacterium]
MKEHQHLEIVSAFAKAIEARDEHTKWHSYRVANYSYHLARQLNLSQEEVQLVYWASILHDVGKIGVPEAILNKKGPLTSVERKIIQLHPVTGARILEPLGSFKEIVPIIYHHHERFDGMGYPGGLTGEQIPLLSRIITVADSFEAMTADRCYRGKLSCYNALEELKKNSGTQFDPVVISAFVKIKRNHGFFSDYEAVDYMI